MKNLKTIILILAFGLMSNVVFAQSKAIKVDKKTLTTAPQSKSETSVSEWKVQSEPVKAPKPASTVPAATYTPSSSSSNNNVPKSTTPTQAQPIQSSGSNNSIPANSYPSKSSKESKK